jgi:hypothetical protein
MEKLILTVQMHEAMRVLRIQHHEAEAVAQKLLDHLCEVVEEDGQMFCNRERLIAILTAVREENQQKHKRII